MSGQCFVDKRQLFGNPRKIQITNGKKNMNFEIVNEEKINEKEKGNKKEQKCFEISVTFLSFLFRILKN